MGCCRSLGERSRNHPRKPSPAASDSYHGTMTNHDAAFLWETAVLRERRSEAPRPSTLLSPGWVTLREAHQKTGVPIDTLRKWGRQGSVPSMVVETAEGLRRLVRLESVIGRAQAQGRDVPNEAPSPPPAESTSVADGTTRAVAPRPTAETGSTTTAEGTMIVPLEAWDRMLMQLGNLHEAGQQLAEARERAARAETEATFLRERLAEMRAQDQTPAASAPDLEVAASQPTPPAPAEARAVEPVWEYAVRRWRLWRRR